MLLALLLAATTRNHERHLRPTVPLIKPGWYRQLQASRRLRSIRRQHPLGFTPVTVRRMAKAGQLPGRPMGTGKGVFWRFRISEIEAAMPHNLRSPQCERKER